MSKSVNKFHYVDADGNDTSPEMATRITLLVYDEKQKISKRFLVITCLAESYGEI